MCLELDGAVIAALKAGHPISDHQRKFRGLPGPLNGEWRAPYSSTP